ncbi:AbiH family protein [Lactiplantibacillus xiangfangensis]|uniref:Uncharacterized protein n=1 Tax=Lactiplantibacillus xiangfangensis TaxID=942150 RepID=A0A0R2M2S9_9LACO|nr:AbiH family protein [Lactiplantibacillus xiangfangensis]KRO08408.1 hypothetical protein IV64_GL000494 [Lactiplantibacillus xiangfangensis]
MSNSNKLLVLGNGSDLYQGYPYSYSDFFRDRYTPLFLEDGTTIRDNIYQLLLKVVNFFYDAYDGKHSFGITIEQDSPPFDVLKTLASKNLNTEIEAFFSKFSPVFNSNNFSLLDLIFLYPDLISSIPNISQNLNKKQVNWSDIESVIALCSSSLDNASETQFHQKFASTVKALTVLQNSNSSTRINLIEQLDTSKIGDEHTQKKDFHIDMLHQVLLDSVNRIEERFQEYLLEHPATGTSDYPSNHKKEIMHNVLPTDSFTTTVLNFNYTNFNEHIPTIHPHGSLEYRNIIFGINSTVQGKNISTEFGSFQLTKTYRGLLNQTLYPDSARISLPKNVNEIIFFGHSLNTSDYDYFYSIFDSYNLYDSNLKLTFYYALHGNAVQPGFINTLDLKKIQNQQIQTEQVAPVAKLINQYGNSLQVSEHGTNLMHRLLLEQRIKILNIEETDRYTKSQV